MPNRDYLSSSIKYEGGRLVDEQGERGAAKEAVPARCLRLRLASTCACACVLLKGARKDNRGPSNEHRLLVSMPADRPPSPPAGEGVMMDWETDLMRRHAEIICRGGGDVLNVGFGMGIVDGFIQEHQVPLRLPPSRCPVAPVDPKSDWVLARARHRHLHLGLSAQDAMRALPACACSPDACHACRPCENPNHTPPPPPTHPPTPPWGSLQPRSHTIIEAHPDVYAYACSQGWDKRPGVRLVHGRWQDVIDQV